MNKAAQGRRGAAADADAGLAAVQRPDRRGRAADTRLGAGAFKPAAEPAGADIRRNGLGFFRPHGRPHAAGLARLRHLAAQRCGQDIQGALCDNRRGQLDRQDGLCPANGLQPRPRRQARRIF